MNARNQNIKIISELMKNSIQFLCAFGHWLHPGLKDHNGISNFGENMNELWDLHHYYFIIMFEIHCMVFLWKIP